MKLAFWLKFSIFNLVIVSLLGLLMRYKIAFSFPWLDQKHVQEAHSHFAFYGWITSCLYVLIIRYLKKNFPQISLGKYNYAVILNIMFSFGMLGAFLYGGYFWLSILFSALALFVSFGFFFFLIFDLKNVDDESKPWFLGGLFFATLSCLGVFYLGYMMSSGNINQDYYLASTYYYLHFQYNGFFIFSCIGLLLNALKEIGAKILPSDNKIMIWTMFFGCLIGFGLSVLWMKLPLWIFGIIVVGSILQTFGSFKLFVLVKSNWNKLIGNWTPLERFVLVFAGFAYAVKILLQLGSNIPALNQFAFGFRNVVIAYLHLVLLMCISVFLVGRILASGYFSQNKNLATGLKLFLLGIFLNEALLGVMGVFSIKYVAIPYSGEMLVVISALILLGVLWILFNMKTNSRTHME